LRCPENIVSLKEDKLCDMGPVSEAKEGMEGQGIVYVCQLRL